MCGISIAIHTNPDQAKTNVSKLYLAQKHRGPDGGSEKHFPFAKESFIGLGHNLLSFTGNRTDGLQPVHDVASNTVFLFNGEVYNHHALRSLPIFSSHQWQTDTDTEVIHQLLVKGKVPALKELEGMFALALADLNQGILLLARDVAGMKPLFYYSDEAGNFLVASELSAITKCLDAPKLNKLAASHLLRYKYAPAPETIVEGVQELMPGTYLIWNNGKVETGFWATPMPGEPSHNIRQTIIKEHLYQGIESHTDGIENVALLLSGGVDSTLLLSQLVKQQNKQIIAYSAVPEGGADPDAQAAEEAAAQYGVTWKGIAYNASLLSQLPTYAATASLPVADAAGLLTWHLARHIDPNYRVLISGAGADELFMGYNRHLAFEAYLEFPNMLTNGFLKSLAKFGSALFGIKVYKRVSQFLDSITKDPLETWDNMRANNGFAMENLPHFKAITQPIPAEPNTMDYAAQSDRGHYLPFDILNMSDSAAMAFGKEMRMPYLHTPLWHSVNGMRATQFIEIYQKWVLKKFLQEEGGAKFTKRQKKGFGIDWSHWLYQTTEGKTLLQTLANSVVSKALVSPSFFQLILKEKRYAQQALSLLFIHYWVEANGVGM